MNIGDNVNRLLNFINVILIIILIFVVAEIAKSETYVFKGDLKIQAPTFKIAAIKCFHTLTKGVYQGEEASLVIIDTCANPIRGNVLK